MHNYFEIIQLIITVGIALAMPFILLGLKRLLSSIDFLHSRITKCSEDHVHKDFCGERSGAIKKEIEETKHDLKHHMEAH